MKKKFDLQERLIGFALMVMKVVEMLPKTYNGQHFARQLIRSGTSPAFNYGEAKYAESRKDFVHKMKVAQKELGETYICLRIIKQHPLLEGDLIEDCLSECDQLIAIMFSSIKTAKENMNRSNKK